MSARAEASPVRDTFSAAIAAAIVVALGIGALAGAVVTRVVADRPSAATAVTAPMWDAQKLEAMEGRQLAEMFRTEVTEVRTSLEPGELKAILEGRAFADEVGAEDPIVKPHVPKRPPSG